MADEAQSTVTTRRDVGIWGAALLALNGMIGAAIFGLPGKLDAAVGSFAPWLLLLAGIGIMPVVLCYADLALVKKCENPVCVLFFYDTSKNHSRRWCSMSVCGNRMKVAAHYQRLRKAR